MTSAINLLDLNPPKTASHFGCPNWVVWSIASARYSGPNAAQRGIAYILNDVPGAARNALAGSRFGGVLRTRIRYHQATDMRTSSRRVPNGTCTPESASTTLSAMAMNTNHDTGGTVLTGRLRRSALTVVGAIIMLVGAASVSEAQSGTKTGLEVTVASSCLAGNGRVDINIVNTGAVAAEYRVQFGSLSPRALTVQPRDWWRTPITGRPDGTFALVVTRNGVPVALSQETVEVACDTSPPQLATGEVQIISACRGGNGYLLFQFVNDSSSAKPYVIEFGVIPNRSTTAGAYGQSVRAVTGRPDGDHEYTVTSGQNRVQSGSVTVSCDESADFSGQTLTSELFSDLDLIGANFSNADLSGSVFGDVVATDASFADAQLTDAVFTSFSILDRAGFQDTQAVGVAFDRVSAVGASFAGAILTDVVFNQSNFTNADFTDADLTDSAFLTTDVTGAIWTNATCSNGVKAEDQGGSCI